MKKILIFLSLFSAKAALAQLNLAAAGMPFLQQQSSLNPSFIPTHRFVIGGDVEAGAYNSFRGLKVVNSKIYAGHSADPSVLYTRLNCNLLNAGLRIGKKSYLTFSESVRQLNFGSLSSDGLGMLLHGNAPYIGQTVNANPNIQSLFYNELSLGFAQKIGKLQLGVRGKMWNGVGAISTGADQKLSVLTEKDAYQLTLNSDYSIYAAPSVDVDGLLNGGFALSGLKPDSKGWGVDLGARFEFNDKFSVSASMIDLGSIQWVGRKNTSKGTVRYEGFDATKAFTDRGDLTFGVNLDTLVDQLKFRSTDGVGFTTTLPQTFLVSGTYRFGDKLTATCLYSGTSYQKTSMNTIMINGQYQALGFLNLGLSYSLRDATSLLGANLTLGSRTVQAFVMTDNLPGFFRPVRTSILNVRMGLNLRFGRMNK